MSCLSEEELLMNLKWFRATDITIDGVQADGKFTFKCDSYNSHWNILDWSAAIQAATAKTLSCRYTESSCPIMTNITAEKQPIDFEPINWPTGNYMSYTVYIDHPKTMMVPIDTDTLEYHQTLEMCNNNLDMTYDFLVKCYIANHLPISWYIPKNS